jgi:hypothetical protein
MPLAHREVNIHMAVQRIDSVDPLLPLAREREAHDPQWQGRSYSAELRKRILRGDWCLSSVINGEIISVMFLSKGPCWLGPVAYSLSLPQGIIGFYDVYTLPTYRRQGLYRDLFLTGINSCLDAGYKRVWMWIMLHNRTSVIVHDKLGLNHIIRSISLRQRWGFKWHKMKCLDINITKLESCS